LLQHRAPPVSGLTGVSHCERLDSVGWRNKYIANAIEPLVYSASDEADINGPSTSISETISEMTQKSVGEHPPLEAELLERSASLDFIHQRSATNAKRVTRIEIWSSNAELLEDRCMI
jgi:hypothetical protein